MTLDTPTVETRAGNSDSHHRSENSSVTSEESGSIDLTSLVADRNRDIINFFKAGRINGEKALSQLNEVAEVRRKARVFTLKDAAEMIGVTPNGIRHAENQNPGLPEPNKDPKTGKRIGYTLEEIEKMRRYFGVEPAGRRNPELDLPCVTSFFAFKGGSTKTTNNVAFSQFCALRGMRVLVIDLDGQASATEQLGFNPNREFKPEDTIVSYLEGDQPDLKYAIQKTSWHGIDLIPAMIKTAACDFVVADIASDTSANAGNLFSTDSNGWTTVLKDGIDSVADDYDIVIIDPPPSLGMMSVNIFKALHGMIVPIVPSMNDYHSTITFFRMMEDMLEGLQRDGLGTDLKFLKLLITKYTPGATADQELTSLIRATFPEEVLVDYPMLNSVEVLNASVEHETVYDTSKPRTNRKTYNRCMDSMDAVFGEVLKDIQKTWPSHKQIDGARLWESAAE